MLATRPIYHSSDMAIRGHVFCSFLALLLVKELEDRLRRHGIAAEWGDILRDLDRLQEIQLDQDGKRFLLRTPTTGVAGKLFQAVGVGLMDAGSLFAAHGVGIILTLAASAAIGIMLTGWISQLLLRKS